MNRKVNFSLLLSLLIAALASFWNLFGYPTIAEDEGVYVSQGWWLVNFGQLSPYTYWYDHAPVGWFQIGLWQKLLGGPFAFGLSVFTGRVIITIFSLGATFFLYKTAQQISQSNKVAFLASSIFILSPLALFFHRRVLLDNIMVFWLMVALYFLFCAKGHLWRFFVSGLALGLAFLSKETALFFLPIFSLSAFIESAKSIRRLAVTFLVVTFLWLSAFFPLLAVLKGEFLPSKNHVSLVQTLTFHAQRGQSRLPFWEAKSDFGRNWSLWAKKDFFFITFGFWSVFVCLLFGDHRTKLVSLSALGYSAFLVRGGIVYDFYIVPLIPFLALCLSLSFAIIFAKLSPHSPRLLFFSPPLLLLLCLLVVSDRDLFVKDATKNHRQIVDYTRKNIPATATIAADPSLWLDLKFPYENIHWYNKIEQDPAVTKNVDYLFLTSGIIQSINSGQFPVMQKIYQNSQETFDFPPLLSPRLFASPADRVKWGDDSWITVMRHSSSVSR